MDQRAERPRYLEWVICIMLVWQVLSPVLWFGSALRWSIFVAVQVIGVLGVWAMWRGYFWIRWLTIAGCLLTLPDILNIIQPQPVQTVSRVVNIGFSIFLLYWFNTGPVRTFYRRRQSPIVPGQ
jgi:hypothetical protein